MGAPLGNEYWRQRADLSKDGRKLSVEQVKTKLQEYIERCFTDKLYEPDWVGKDSREVQRPRMIVMSIYGACAYLAISIQTWYDWKADKKYIEVLSRAENVFKSYNLEGASAGMLKENLVARIEGLKENQDHTTNGKDIKPLIVKWGDSELEI